MVTPLVKTTVNKKFQRKNRRSLLIYIATEQQYMARKLMFLLNLLLKFIARFGGRYYSVVRFLVLPKKEFLLNAVRVSTEHLHWLSRQVYPDVVVIKAHGWLPEMRLWPMAMDV